MTPPESRQVDAFSQARDAVLARIAGACSRAGRDPASVTLVAVSKTVDAERLRVAVAAGLTLLGENRVQEAAAKAPEVPGARWQLVGPLQSNKARRALEVFESIQSVDFGGARRAARPALARRSRPGPLPGPAPGDVDLDPAKHGFQPDAVAAALPALLELPNLEVRGLMTVGRFTDDPDVSRSTFRELRALSDALRADQPDLGPELSMGMTDDFEIAIEEGATIVRVGRALFGERPAGGW